jgi:hypothetical protein
MTILRKYIRELLIIEAIALQSQRETREALELKKILGEAIEDIKTIGDLKALINKAIKKQKFKSPQGTKGVVAKAGLDIVVDSVPGLGIAKTVARALFSLYSQKDTSRPKGPLGALDVDDDVADIVDDKVENEFLNAVSKELESMSDNEPLDKFNMTDRLARYIATKFNKRTVAGF